MFFPLVFQAPIQLARPRRLVNELNPGSHFMRTNTFSARDVMNTIQPEGEEICAFSLHIFLLKVQISHPKTQTRIDSLWAVSKYTFLNSLFFSFFCLFFEKAIRIFLMVRKCPNCRKRSYNYFPCALGYFGGGGPGNNYGHNQFGGDFQGGARGRGGEYKSLAV